MKVKNNNENGHLWDSNWRPPGKKIIAKRSTDWALIKDVYADSFLLWMRSIKVLNFGFFFVWGILLQKRAQTVTKLFLQKF